MENYNNLIDEVLKGNNPKEKYDFLVSLLKIIRPIVFPKRGTFEESLKIEDVSYELEKVGSFEYFENIEKHIK